MPDASIRRSQVTPLLRHHPSLQEELRGLLQQFHHRSLSLAATSRDMDAVPESPDGVRRTEACERAHAGPDAEEEREAGRPVFARNISLISSGEKVVAWTR